MYGFRLCRPCRCGCKPATPPRCPSAVTVTRCVTSARVNQYISGPNGSGKRPAYWRRSTCSAWQLSSFRSQRLSPVIQHEQPACTVFGQVLWNDGRVRNLGVARNRLGELQIRIDGQNVRSAAQLAESLPLQLINPDSFRLLEGAPKVRRQFLDWGVFHVEQRFLPAWDRLQTALRQRNSWLRHGRIDPVSQAAWDRELCLRRSDSELLRAGRERCSARFLLLPFRAISNWGIPRRPQRADRRRRLARTMPRTCCRAVTRSWWSVRLKIAQGHLVDRARRECIYLVDDLPSELDEQHRRALCRLLEELHCQVFITCVDLEALREGWRTDTPVALFHVNRALITQPTIGSEGNDRKPTYDSSSIKS
uniref:DNA replication and repair protein RecF n=1 Tax=Azotobacter vinelandii TaxID=354 RepID=RECF_AZOVI|nr:RecName: Full=DNA replication and repair protein RecF [Azotobacter vinelandii]CAA60158.1 recF [Azotobacter vinelandii]